MSKKIIVWGLAFAVIHLAVTLAALVLAISGMGDFYEGEPARPTGMQGAINTVAAILMEPLELAWTPWMSRHMPGFVEWLLFFGNSLLWGFAAAFVWSVRGFRKRAGQPA